MSLSQEQLASAAAYNRRQQGRLWLGQQLPDQTLRSLAADSSAFAERVAALQVQHGLPVVDGELGPHTLQALQEEALALEIARERTRPADYSWWRPGQPWPSAETIANVDLPDDDEPLDHYLDRMGCPHWTAWELTYLKNWRRNVVPARPNWPNIVATLRLAEILRDELGGHGLHTGNGYRPRSYNAEAGGAQNSQHIDFRAMDIDLQGPQAAGAGAQRALYEVSARLFCTYGRALEMGLGFYAPTRGTRVHIDTGFKCRHWNSDHVLRVVKELGLEPP